MSTIEQIMSAPLESRERWSVALNCWEWPADFPMPEPAEFSAMSRDDKFEFPPFREAIDAVRSTLTEEQQSWAWWRIELQKSHAEWSAWWENQMARKAIGMDTL